jgi:hypothetical protein
MNLNLMTVSQLRKLAVEFGIAGRSTMKKAELIAALSAAEFANILELKAGIAEVEAEEREMNEIRAEIAAEKSDVEAGELLDAALGEYVEPTASTGRIAITKYSASEAIATVAFSDGSTVCAHVKRERGRWALRDGAHTIRAKTLGKAGKLWAKALSFHATTIDIDTMN